jgi:hypothetical protein
MWICDSDPGIHHAEIKDLFGQAYPATWGKASVATVFMWGRGWCGDDIVQHVMALLWVNMTKLYLILA